MSDRDDIRESAAAASPPIPFGVEAETGRTRPPLTDADLRAMRADPQGATSRVSQPKQLAVVPTVDRAALDSAGWGVVFAKDIEASVKTALEPLLRHREREVHDPALFKIFEGSHGVRSGMQTAPDWLDRFGLGLGPVDPSLGIPYYLLLVGSPQQISFDFQAVLDTQWAVGRVHFETPAEYEAWARAVVAYETAPTVAHRKRAAIWMPRHDGDAATTMLLKQVGEPFVKSGLAVGKGYQLDSFVDAHATKECLAQILAGTATGGKPAVLFTGSHGAEWPLSDPTAQRDRQGALVTQEWTPGTPLKPGQYFSGGDVAPDITLDGMMCVLFACFGGGCPTTDSYRSAPDGSPISIAEQALIARLPQRLLSQGALAVLAHVDRAWSWSFQSGSGLPQNRMLKSAIESLMLGFRAGEAADVFNLQWSTLAAVAGLGQRPGAAAGPGTSPAALTNLWFARDDAKNYALLGDPAARLRLADMSP
jgi:Peptidase family C25